MIESELGKIEIALEREIYKRSFYEFYKAAFCQLHPGEEYDENWHAKYICDILQAEAERVHAKIPREKDIIINVPPRSSKSMIATVIWPVWCWAALNTGFKFLRCSYSDTIATDLSRKSKDLILTNWFQRLYGSKIKLRGDLSGAGYFANIDRGFMYAFGLDGTVTGMGGDFIIADDPQNPKKAASEVERENAITRWNETVSNRLNQLEIGGRIIVMQRLHERDIPGSLLDKKDGKPDQINHICIPVEYDEKIVKPPELKQYYHGKFFWPTRFSDNVIKDERKKGSLYFSGQFQQIPVPVEGNLFKRAWIEIMEPEMVQRNANASPVMFFIDSAFTEDEQEGNDPTGLLAAFRKDQFIYVINFSEVWMEFPKLLKYIKDYAVLHGATNHSAIYIEPKANGKSIAQQLRASTSLNVIEIDDEWVRDDKVTRASGVSPIVEARRMKLIRGEWNESYLAYLTGFPKSLHDEAVDTTVYMLNRLLPTKEFFADWI